METAVFSSREKWWLLMAVAAGIVILDQSIKQLVSVFMPYGASYPVTAFFNLVHVRNPGAAFSFLASAGGWQRYFFISLGVLVSFVLVWVLKRGVESRLDAAAYTLILGGALGNIADRVGRGAVVDYLDFHWQGWHWPAFNVADIAISCGAIAILVSAFRPVRASRSGATP